MTDIDDRMTQLPRLALSEIPTPRPDAMRITALVRENGRISGYRLSDGSVLNKADGVKLAKEGGILDVGVAVRNGNEYLKSLPDASEGNNLANLPSIVQ